MRFLIGTLLPLLLGASEYIITYKIVVRDAIIYNELYHVSRAMVESKETDYRAVCRFRLDEIDQDKIYDFLKEERDQVLECLFYHGVRLDDRSLFSQGMGRSQTVLKIPPTRVKAEVKDEFVTIGIISTL